jgi:hypothetical protein
LFVCFCFCFCFFFGGGGGKLFGFHECCSRMLSINNRFFSKAIEFELLTIFSPISCWPVVCC